MNQSVEQLLLPLKIDQSASFENFYTQDDFVISSLKKLAKSPNDFFVLLSGQANTGKTHLLQALLRLFQDQSIKAHYFYAEMLFDAPTDVISFDSQNVILIDDIHLLAQHPLWERKLYDLYNEAQRNNALLVCSCSQSDSLKFALKDWASRIQSGLQLSLSVPNEQLIKEIIKFRARCMGLKLADGVLDYLFSRFSRDLIVQMSIMKQLDKQSLQNGRRVTIPFIKSCDLDY